MPRKKKDRKIGNTSEGAIRAAVAMVLDKDFSVREAARSCNIRFQTLVRYVQKQKNNTDREVSMKPNYEHRKIFNEDQERDFADYLKTCSKMAYGMTTENLRRLAYELAVANELHIPASWTQTRLAGIDWLRAFLRRNKDLSIRKPEACSPGILSSFNKHNVKIFFDNLKSTLQRFPNLAGGSRIFNLDEIGTTTVQAPKKIIVPKGVKQVHKATSRERGELVTMCSIVSGIGTFLPPAIIFPRKYYKDYMLKDAPPATLGLAAPTGWMNTDLFVEVFDHFVKHSNSSQNTPSIPIYDNHESHISIRVLQKARNAGVHIITLPHHSSHKMQSLEVGVPGPFKAYFDKAYDDWMLLNPGQPLTINHMAGCVAKAFNKAYTSTNIMAGFQKSGIVPFDSDIFTDADFMSSSVTDRPLENEANTADHNVTAPISETENVTQLIATLSISKTIVTDASQPGCSFDCAVERQMTPPPIPNNSVVTPPGFDTLEEIKGFSKTGPRKQVRKPRQKGRSALITSTPEKMLTAEKEKLKLENQQLKFAKIGKKTNFNIKSVQENEQPKNKRRKTEKENKKRLTSPSETSEDGSVEYQEESEVENWIPEEPQADITKEIDKEHITPRKFVLVKFPKNVFYIGKILTNNSHLKELEVSFLRKSSKISNSFLFPEVPDVSAIDFNNVKIILPNSIAGRGTNSGTSKY